MGESVFVWPSPTIVCDVPPSPGERGLSFGRMDSATTPSAPRRMTGQRHTAKNESFQTRETKKRKSVAMSIDLGLMLCALVLG